MNALRQYQIEGVHWLLDGEYRMLGDEQGLGKTVQVCMAIPATPALIVCPSSVIGVWADELQKWRPDLRVNCIVKNGEALDPDAVNITSYGLLRTLPKRVRLHVLVGDEAHYLKNRLSQRARAFARLSVRSQYTWLLTGTPMPSKTRELWTALRLLRATELDYNEYTKRYSAARWRVQTSRRRDDEQSIETATHRMVWDDGGASNLKELRELLAPYVLRRLKVDHLDELPPKTYEVVPLRYRESYRTRELRDALLAYHADQPEPTEEEQERIEWLMARENSSKHRHHIGREKLPHALAYIVDWLEDNEDAKLVLFAHHTDIIDSLANKLANFGVHVVDGRKTVRERRDAVRAFQTDPRLRVFVGQMIAAGTGLTLTAAHTVMFVELDWVPGVMLQATDRIHRIGQQQPCTIQFLVGGDGVENIMMRTLLRKIGNIDNVVDAKRRGAYN